MTALIALTGAKAAHRKRLVVLRGVHISSCLLKRVHHNVKHPVSQSFIGHDERYDRVSAGEGAPTKNLRAIVYALQWQRTECADFTLQRLKARTVAVRAIWDG